MRSQWRKLRDEEIVTAAGPQKEQEGGKPGFVGCSLEEAEWRAMNYHEQEFMAF